VFHVKHSDLASDALAVGAHLSGDQLERVAGYEDLLIEIAVPKGFVGEADRREVRGRHVLDSIRAAPLLESGTVADLGSGAGLPGVVVALARPDVLVDLIEPMRRRLAFLELVIERLEIPNARVVPRRAETLSAGAYDGALARALAPPAETWAIARAALRDAGRLVYFAGRGFEPEPFEGAVIEVVGPPPRLESAGPLVIMTRR